MIFTILMAGLILSSFLCLYRIAIGPSITDRSVSIDILGTIVVGFCAVLSIKTGREFYLTIGIAWSLLAFITGIALAKFLEGKHLDE